MKNNVVIAWGLLMAGLIVGGAVHFSQKKQEPIIYKSKAPLTLPTENVTKHVLSNGMNVLVCEDHSVPKVLLQIAYLGVGSGVENTGDTTGERGLAHLLEHMVFKGTKKLAEGDLDAIARKLGATFNAYTSEDTTAYFFEVGSSNWKPFVEIFADCMQNSRFEKEHLASEVKAVIAELKMYKDHYWRMMMETACELAFPPNHPYHFPTIGFKEDLLDVTPEKLHRFYKKYYHPSNATMFVVGDVRADEVIAEVEKQFGSIPAGKERVSTNHFSHPTNSFMAHTTTIYRDIAHPLLGFYWVIPGLKAQQEATIQALEFLLGGGEGSRLYRRLVDEEKVASSIDVGTLEMMNASIFLLLITPQEGKLDYIRAVVEEELSKLIAQGVTPHELTKVVSNKQREILETFESHHSFVQKWVDSYHATGDELDVFNQVNQFNSVTSNVLQSFANTYLSPFLMNEIKMLPAPADFKKRLLENQSQEDALDSVILNKHKRTAPLETLKAVHQIKEVNSLQFNFPHPTKLFTLPNGLEVVIHSNKSWPLISAQLLFKDNYYYNGAKEGLPLAIMMPLLIEGSKEFSKQDNVEFFEAHGARYLFSAAGAGISGLSSDTEALLERLLYIIKNPTFPTAALEKLKANEVNELMRAKQEPGAVAMRLFKNAVYGVEHPFSWTLDDAISLFKSLSLEEIKSYYQKHLSPANMILTISGNCSDDEIQKIVTKIFGNWEGAPYEQHKVTSLTKQAQAQSIDHFMLRNQVVLMFGRRSPLTIFDQDLIPLKLLDYIAFYSLGSRLLQLREETGLFYTARGAFATQATKEAGYDFLYALVSLDRVEEAEAGIRNVIKEMAEKGVSEQELNTARQLYVKNLIDAASSNRSIAATLNNLAALDLGFDYYDKVLKRVNSITAQELNEIAKKYYSTENMTRVRVGRVGEEKK